MGRREDRKYVRDGDGPGYQIYPGQTLGAEVVTTMTQDGSASQSCIQTLTTTGSPDGGQFKLRCRGKPTAALSFNCSASQVQAALEALSSVGSGNVGCTGGPLNTTPIVVTFSGDLANTQIALIKALFGKLEGGNLNHNKGDFGWVAKLEGDLGSETVSFEVVECYNRFQDLDAGLNLQCLYANTGKGDELVQVECVEV